MWHLSTSSVCHQLSPLQTQLQEGDVAPFGQQLDGCQAQRCWEEVVASSTFEQRQAAVQQHNAGGAQQLSRRLPLRRCLIWLA